MVRNFTTGKYGTKSMNENVINVYVSSLDLKPPKRVKSYRTQTTKKI